MVHGLIFSLVQCPVLLVSSLHPLWHLVFYDFFTNNSSVMKENVYVSSFYIYGYRLRLSPVFIWIMPGPSWQGQILFSILAVNVIGIEILVYIIVDNFFQGPNLHFMSFWAPIQIFNYFLCLLNVNSVSVLWY